MKKVAIITLFGNYNYGNKLQNFAVQELLCEYGYQPDTLVFYFSRLKAIVRNIKHFIKYFMRNPYELREATFRRFNNEKLKIRKIYAPKYKVSSQIKNDYKYFIVGSDQVWNPEIRKNERGIFFLQFVDPEQRICISPSIGLKRIDDQYKNLFYEGLIGFKYLCCRENEGTNEIIRITKKKCEFLIDPTMAVSVNKWRLFSLEKKVTINSKYILCYFLGDFNSILKEKALIFAKEHNLEIIEPSNINSIYYHSDPREMVSLIDQASLVLTDSFHICTFSIILKKPFWVFDRYSKSAKTNHINSRISSLVDRFGLNSRYKSIDSVEFNESCDFSTSENRLILEKDKFDKYFRKCLNISNFK